MIIEKKFLKTNFGLQFSNKISPFTSSQTKKIVIIATVALTFLGLMYLGVIKYLKSKSITVAKSKNHENDSPLPKLKTSQTKLDENPTLDSLNARKETLKTESPSLKLNNPGKKDDQSANLTPDDIQTNTLLDKMNANTKDLNNKITKAHASLSSTRATMDSLREQNILSREAGTIREEISNDWFDTGVEITVNKTSINTMYKLNLRKHNSGQILGFIDIVIQDDHLEIVYIKSHDQSKFKDVGLNLLRAAVKKSIDLGFQGKLKVSTENDGPGFFYLHGFSAINDQNRYGHQIKNINDAFKNAHIKKCKTPLNDADPFPSDLNVKCPQALKDASKILKQEKKLGNIPSGKITYKVFNEHWFWDNRTPPLIDKNTQIEKQLMKGKIKGERLPTAQYSGEMVLPAVKTIDNWEKLVAKRKLFEFE